MSCTTGYLIRGVSGVWRMYSSKHGPWLLLDEGGRDALLAEVRERGWIARGEAETGRPGYGGWLCRGVLLDMVERRLRVYACAGQMDHPAVGWVECHERALAQAELWAGWDLGYAWGRRADFAELAPELASDIEAEGFERPELETLDASLVDWEAGLRQWDPASMLLRYSDLPWAGGSRLAVVSVIDERLRVYDYLLWGKDAAVAVPWLLHGEQLLDALTARPPHGSPHENEVREAVIVDREARRIRYWSAEVIPPQLLAELAAAWPGWQIERLAFGYAGHLAATGRRAPELLITDEELCAKHFDPGWRRERAELARDPRPLRAVEERLEL